MLRVEAQQGIRQVIATPHFYAHSDSPERFLERRDQAACILRDEIAGQEDLPQILLGAEVLFFPGISDSDMISELTISGKGCILLEMPLSPWSDRMYREIEGIWTKQGITPIIAHVDRYISPFGTHGIPRRLEELPVLVQANAGFFLNWSTSAMAMRMLQRGQIHLLGSDCHNLHSRPPRMGDAIEKIRQRLGTEALERIRENQRAVLGLAAD